MVRVRFVTREYDEEQASFRTHLRAELAIEGSHESITGDRRWVSLEVGVIDPHNGREVTFQSDPERWALLLPLAYRSGDVSVEVTETRAIAVEEVGVGSGSGSGSRSR